MFISLRPEHTGRQIAATRHSNKFHRAREQNTTLSCLVSILNMLHHVVPAWTLAQDWSNDNNWLCPPVNLIVQTIRKLQSCNGIGALIIPEWPSSLFWPYLHSSDLVFKSYVKAVFCLPKLHDLLIEGPGQRAVYKRKKSVFSRCL